MAGQEHTSVHRGHTTSTTWKAASRSLTSCRIRRDPDACVVLGERKQSRLVRGAHASIAGQPSSHIWATRAHNQHHMAGSKPITHGLQNQEGSRCMCGVGRNKTKQADQGGTCQHSLPASHMEYSRAHNPHHMAQRARARACQALLQVLSREAHSGGPIGALLAREGVVVPSGPCGKPGAYRGVRLLPGKALDRAAPELRQLLARAVLARLPHAMRWMAGHPQPVGGWELSRHHTSCNWTVLSYVWRFMIVHLEALACQAGSGNGGWTQCRTACGGPCNPPYHHPLPPPVCCRQRQPSSQGGITRAVCAWRGGVEGNMVERNAGWRNVCDRWQGDEWHGWQRGRRERRGGACEVCATGWGRRDGAGSFVLF